MHYLAERRQEEKTRRRAEILDAVERVALNRGWEAMTMDEIARTARLSRALLYVYFEDKNALLFAIGERGLRTLHSKFVACEQQKVPGLVQVTAMGRAYLNFATEYPVYFAAMLRCDLSSPNSEQLSDHERACMQAGDTVHQTLCASITLGISDGSIRENAGEPNFVAVVLWSFLHGVLQIATNKANFLAHRGIDIEQLMEQALNQATLSIAGKSP
jgi:TetR/AcrR family transcriptional regulator